MCWVGALVCVPFLQSQPSPPHTICVDMTLIECGFSRLCLSSARALFLSRFLSFSLSLPYSLIVSLSLFLSCTGSVCPCLKHTLTEAPVEKIVVIVEKEKIGEVPIEKIIETEKIVEKIVQVPVPVETIRTVEVCKVPVETKKETNKALAYLSTLPAMFPIAEQDLEVAIHDEKEDISISTYKELTVMPSRYWAPSLSPFPKPEHPSPVAEVLPAPENLPKSIESQLFSSCTQTHTQPCCTQQGLLYSNSTHCNQVTSWSIPLSPQPSPRPPGPSFTSSPRDFPRTTVRGEPQVLSALPPYKLEVSTYSPPTSQTNGQKVGVGLLLAYSRNGQGEEVEVSDIIPAFSAAESNQFDVGDVVLCIDGISVRRMPLAEVKKLTIGEVGTTVQFIMRSHTEVLSFVAKPLP